MKRFALVDALRGIASLSVVLFHAVTSGHIPALLVSMPGWIQAPLRHGDMGVAIFFVLSGFVIAHSLRDGMCGIGDLGRFMLRRSIRLDPPYWSAIAIAICFSVVASTFINGRAPDRFTASQLAAHALYLQDLLGIREINPVFWTLCLEIQFYLVFALLLLTRSKLMLGIAIILSLPLSIYPLHEGLFTSLWYGFLLGVSAYAGRLWFVTYAAALCMIGIYRADIFMLVCVATSVLLFVASIYGTLTTWLSWRWLQFLGAISYSLYLLHNPITGAVFRVGYLFLGHSIYAEAAVWIFSLLCCIGAAWLMLLFVERPSTRLSKMISPLSQQHPMGMRT